MQVMVKNPGLFFGAGSLGATPAPYPLSRKKIPPNLHLLIGEGWSKKIFPGKGYEGLWRPSK